MMHLRLHLLHWYRLLEDSGPRLITQAQLLANAADVDGPSLTATGLAISTGSGSLVNNGDGTWTYTPALNDDTNITFTYTVSDGSLSAAGSS
jgi:large repetitive protein